MIKKITLKHKGILSFKWINILFLFLWFAVGAPVMAQTSISTTASFLNTETVSTVTFNFQNTNTYPVIITDIAGIVTTYGSNTVQIWSKNTAINGAPGNIATTNGWVLAGTQIIAGVENNSTTVTQPLIGNLNLLIPANSTYGIAVAVYNTSGGTQRTGTTTGTVTLSGGGCNIITGTDIGYAASAVPPAAPTSTLRGWIGKVTFIPGDNCTGTPNIPTASGPANICSAALFTLSAAGYSIGPGIGYQWQYFNTTLNTWVDIPGATNVSYTVTAGITTATEYRLKTSCSFSATQSLSNTVTVNIGSGLAGGTYTINNNAPSTTTNFTSFSAAAAAMSCGISGAVTMNVVVGSGPYNEAVVFNDIPGTSMTNKIRINGNGAIIQDDGDGESGILHIAGTKYLTVDSLTLRSLSQSYPFGIVLSDTALKDSIIRCFVDLRSVNTAPLTNTAGIVLSDYYNTLNYSRASQCFIGYCHVMGANGLGSPYYGIADGYNYYGYETSDSGNVIAYNEIENFTGFGITSSGHGGTEILYNNVHNTHKTETVNFSIGGIYSYGGSYNQNTNSTIKIIGNRIHDPFGMSGNDDNFFCGIQYYNWDYNNNNNNEDQTALIANNAIYNIHLTSAGVAYGILFSDDDYQNNNNNDQIIVCHNTVDISESGDGAVYGIFRNDYYNGNTDNEGIIKNNIVTINGGTAGDKYGFFYSDYDNTGTAVDAQRNNFYLTGPATVNKYYGSYLSTSYLTMSAFQIANPTLEIGSLNVDPDYTNATEGDLTPLNLSLMGNGVNLQAFVTTDILGRPRSTTPTPGAFEIAADAGVTALIAPTGTYCSSVKEVKVAIVNDGNININTVEVHWSLDGVLQPMVTYTGTLLPSNSTTVSLGNGTFLPNTPVIIKAWTSMPNGQPDGLPYNDTLVVSTQSSSSVPVNLGADATICTGNTLTLDAGYASVATYVWDNNATTQTRTISAAGTYYVRLTALDGCIGVDTFNLSLYPLPVVNLGPDREICLGETTTFNAGNPGASYMWDNGSTGQTRTVDTAGSYEVQVTDQHGCMGVDNVDVGMKDIPTVDGINATHADSGTYTFYPINPMYTLSYRWNFGDGSPEADGYFVQHTYTTLGIYNVTLSLEGVCTGLITENSRTVDVFSVTGGTTGIDNRDVDGGFSLYPNPGRDLITIDNKSNEKMQRLMVYNALGQVIIDQQADNIRNHHLHIRTMANGLYTIRIETDKGYVIRKFEVLN